MACVNCRLPCTCCPQLLGANLEPACNTAHLPLLPPPPLLPLAAPAGTSYILQWLGLDEDLVRSSLSLGAIFSSSDSVAALQVGGARACGLGQGGKGTGAPGWQHLAWALPRSLGVGWLGRLPIQPLGGPLSASAIGAPPRSAPQVLDQESSPVLFSLIFGEGVVNDATSIVLLRAVQRIRRGCAAPPARLLCGAHARGGKLRAGDERLAPTAPAGGTLCPPASCCALCPSHLQEELSAECRHIEPHRPQLWPAVCAVPAAGRRRGPLLRFPHQAILCSVRLCCCGCCRSGVDLCGECLALLRSQGPVHFSCLLQQPQAWPDVPLRHPCAPLRCSHSTDREVATVALLGFAAYQLAEGLHLSGIFSVFFCGIVMRWGRDGRLLRAHLH